MQVSRTRPSRPLRWLGPVLLLLGSRCTGVVPHTPRPTTVITPRGEYPDKGGAPTLQEKAALEAYSAALHRAWLADFLKHHRDPRSLRVGYIDAFWFMSAPDLASAVTAADLILVGHVTALTFHSGGQGFTYSLAEFRVERLVKGSAAATVTIQLVGGPDVSADGKTGLLLEAENGPLLFPGDRAVLLLQRYPSLTPYVVQSYSGMYRLEHDSVQALEGNAFAESVNGLSERDFLNLLTDAVSR